MAPTAIAYVMTHYPRVATTFISGEIDEIRRLGGQIHTIAINTPSEQDVPTAQARTERDQTVYLKATGPLRLLSTFLATSLRHPLGMTKLTIRAISSARLDVPLTIRRLAHLCYACVLIKDCRAKDVRHVHAHFGQAPATIAWFTAAVGRLRPDEQYTWSFTIHGFQDFVDENVGRLDLKAADAAFVICVSDFTRAQLCRVADPVYWNRFHVVRCGIDVTAFAMRPIRSMRPVPRVILVSRLSPEKGHLVLFEAARILQDRGIALDIELVGSGPFEAQLRIAEQSFGLLRPVVYLGELLPDMVSQRLTEADIFCLPSFAEGLPVSMMEAMAVGVPVVSTFIAGIPELAVNGETALTVPASNAAELSVALQRLVQDPALVERMVQAARQRVEARHERTTNVGLLADLYRQTVPNSVGHAH